MKKFLLILFLYTFSIFAFSNNVIECVEYDNGNTRYEIIAIPGVDGDTYEYREYYKGGELSAKGDYNEYGHRSGEWIEYYESSQIKSYKFYNNGEKHGVWWFYDKDGSVLYKYEFKRNKKHGEWIQYDKKGELVLKREYKRGKKHGEWKSYDDQGRLLVSEEYNKGELIEGWTWSHDEGLIARYP